MFDHNRQREFNRWVEQKVKPTVLMTRTSINALVPRQGHTGDVGWDLFTCQDQTLPPYGFLDISTGIAIKLPDGYWARITNRSSTKRKWKVDVIEGVIDNGYTGELFIGVTNLRSVEVVVPVHTRLAQLIIQRIEPVLWLTVDELPDTERGSSGFGSTGT